VEIIRKKRRPEQKAQSSQSIRFKSQLGLIKEEASNNNSSSEEYA
jgi:hypothetical protein